MSKLGIFSHDIYGKIFKNLWLNCCGVKDDSIKMLTGIKKFVLRNDTCDGINKITDESIKLLYWMLNNR